MLWTTSHYSALAPGRGGLASRQCGADSFSHRGHGEGTRGVNGGPRRNTQCQLTREHNVQLKPAEAGPGGASAAPASTRLHAHGPGPGPVPAPRVTPRAGALCVVLTLFLFTYASPVCQRRGDCFSAWLMRAPPVPVQPRACHFMLCDLSVRLLAVAQKHEIALTFTSRTRAARGRQRRELRAPGSAARGLRESAAEPRARGRPAQKQALEGDGAGVGTEGQCRARAGWAARSGRVSRTAFPRADSTTSRPCAGCYLPILLAQEEGHARQKPKPGRGAGGEPGCGGHGPRRRPPSQRQGRGRDVTRTTGTGRHARSRRTEAKPAAPQRRPPKPPTARTTARPVETTCTAAPPRTRHQHPGPMAPAVTAGRKSNGRRAGKAALGLTRHILRHLGVPGPTRPAAPAPSRRPRPRHSPSGQGHPRVFMRKNIRTYIKKRKPRN